MEKQNFLFTEENIEIKCDICDSVLSIEPIEYNDLLGYVCGRQKCKNLASAKGANSRQVLYEKVASVFIFPCIYRSNGCTSELKWGEAEQHEESCEFKNFHCPLSKDEFLLEGEDKCEWIGDYADLLSHVQEKHINHFFIDSLDLDLSRDFTEHRGDIYFTRIQQNIVAVVINNIDETSLLYKVYADISIHKFLKYSIKICDSFRNDSTYSSKRKNVELIHKDFWDGKLTNYIKIDLNHIDNFLDDPRFAILEFEYENVKVGQSLIRSNTSLYGFFKGEMKQMKCFKCHRTLFSPIFSCKLGHNVCNLCMKHSKTSPKCCINFISRNNQLEILMFLSDEPCKFNSRGCIFVAPHATIRKHEKMCQFKKINCDECKVQADDIIGHVEEKHENKILSPKVRYKLDRTRNLLGYIPFDGQIFTIQIIYTDINFQLQVECLGFNQLRYKYELCLFDSQYLCSQITWTHLCYPGGVDLSKFGISKTSYIPLSILGQIFPNFESIGFKVEIFKIETVKLDIPSACSNAEGPSEATNTKK